MRMRYSVSAQVAFMHVGTFDKSLHATAHFVGPNALNQMEMLFELQRSISMGEQ